MNVDSLLDRFFDDEPLLQGSHQAAWANIASIEEDLILSGEDVSCLTGTNYLGLYTAEEMMALFEWLTTNQAG